MNKIVYAVTICISSSFYDVTSLTPIISQVAIDDRLDYVQCRLGILAKL